MTVITFSAESSCVPLERYPPQPQRIASLPAFPEILRMRVLTGPQHFIPQFIFTALKIFAYGLAGPFVLVAFLAALSCVVLDFAWFRTHKMLLGDPQPKRLWEF